MSRGILNCLLMGRAGNQMFQYAFCKAWSQQHDLELHVQPWFGNPLFGLNDPPLIDGLPKKSEEELSPDDCNVSFEGYGQCQRCLIYTRTQVREWFSIQKQWTSIIPVPSNSVMAHLRRGDYLSLATYPVVSKSSYDRAMTQRGYNPKDAIWLSEENPTKIEGLPNEFSQWLPDFYLMMNASILFRANSSFSWWAATLGHGRVFAPVVDGKWGGTHDMEFVEGNYPRFCSLDFVEDLYLVE